LVSRLLVLELAETADGGPHSCAVRGRQRPGPTDLHLVARLALPDANSLTLEGELTAPVAEVLRVLRRLQLLDTLSEIRTISRGVLSYDSNLHGALTHD